MQIFPDFTAQQMMIVKDQDFTLLNYKQTTLVNIGHMV